MNFYRFGVSRVVILDDVSLVSQLMMERPGKKFCTRYVIMLHCHMFLHTFLFLREKATVRPKKVRDDTRKRMRR
uniref:Uncharacterized protein n=1 Tax=Brassica oleracea var. oleracea TaxID=109376 RepID=A0A0D3D769_BRAOL